MLDGWNLYSDEPESEEEEDNGAESDVKNLTADETELLKRYVEVLRIGIEEQNMVDPKYVKTVDILKQGVTLESGRKTLPWIKLGCIIFTQYFDTADYVAQNLSKEFSDEIIGLYAGGDKSGYYKDGIKTKDTKDSIKKLVKERKIKILVGTDAASEGLNLQTLGTLINLDLPWNPTKLEQRKGRIQRIGQENDEVCIYNLKYKDSVEDRVHELLSSRLKSIYSMFGQIPDVLEDVWVNVAINDIEAAKKKIEELPAKHPFALKYHGKVKTVSWESCSQVLNNRNIQKQLLSGWEKSNLKL